MHEVSNVLTIHLPALASMVFVLMVALGVLP